MMMGEILSLKTMVGTLARLLNVKYEPLNLTDSEYKNLFLMAELFANEGWPPHVEEMWADTFLRMKIEDFQRLAEVTQDPHPWRPFLKLARSMHESPSNQALKDQFGAGRNNIHAVAGIFCVTAGVSPKDFTLLSERDAVPSKKLIKGRLKSQKAQQDKEEEKNPFQGPF